jgi:hypothetical protein
MKVFWTTSLVLICLLAGAINSIAQGIQVESAYYGSRDGVGVDVTSRVQRFADYGEPFRVGNETLRIDPSPNRPKTLTVVYSVNGRRISETVPEGEVFYFRSGGSKRHLWNRPSPRSGETEIKELGIICRKASEEKRGRQKPSALFL